MDGLEKLTDAIAQRARDESPVIVGIGGAVAVGKSTIAEALADLLRGSGSSAHVLSTDAFLFPNAELAARDLLMRKGFPETYDPVVIADLLGRVRAGEPATARVYSHVIYDIVPDVTHDVPPSDVVIVEGIVALQRPVVEHVSIGVYVDAPEDTIRRWFIDRFVRLAESAETETSFYHRFASLPREQIEQIAGSVWDGVNAVNLHEHIAPSKAAADLVVEKGPDHSIVAVRART